MVDEKHQTQRSSVSRSQVMSMSMSPSRRHGIDFQHEERLRRRYVHFTRELGISLSLPQRVISSATILCHRFFLRQSHSLNDSLLIASACLFLATKSEDFPCPLSLIASASGRLRHMYYANLSASSAPTSSHAHPSAPSHYASSQDKEILLRTEFHILNTIAFDLIVDHPYKPLLASLDKLKQNPQMEKELFMLGERNAMKVHAGTHAPLSKVNRNNDRGDHQFMEKGPVNAPSASRNVPVLNNRAQHQSRYRSSIDHRVLGQASASTSMNTQPNRPILKHRETSANHADLETQQRPVESMHVQRQDPKFTPPVSLQNAGEKALLQVAWNFANDSLLTSLSLQFKPHIIAAAALWLAAKFLEVKLPSVGERGWWRELGTTPQQLEEVGNQILEVCVALDTNDKTSSKNMNSLQP